MPCLSLKDSLMLHEAITNHKDDCFVVGDQTNDLLNATTKDETVKDADKETTDEAPVEKAKEEVAAPVEKTTVKKTTKKKGKAK